MNLHRLLPLFLLAACQAPPEKPPDPPRPDPTTEPAFALLQDATNREAAELNAMMQEILLAVTDAPSAPVYPEANWPRGMGPCGTGARPWVWSSWPALGRQFTITYYPLGSVPNASGQYDLEWAWVLLTPGATLTEPILLPGGCRLWISPADRRSIVWLFRGRDPYFGFLLSRAQNGRTIGFSAVMPNTPELNGLTLHTQMVVIDEGEWKTSGLYRVTFGTP